MNITLATKWRPQTFKDVVGQDLTKQILEKVVQENKPKNAYLFSGDSGCGKTTLARIFANALNEGQGSPIEIDAASNNGVDNVRQIVIDSKKRAFVGVYKIYIIDEAHALTSAAWQAFLKCLEEPASKYTIFIFCTTEPNKIPITILNRMQRYSIVKIDSKLIFERLKYICAQESFVNYEETCELISKICNGCMRDALSILDKCTDFSTDLSLQNAKKVIGDITAENFIKLTAALQDKDEAKVLTLVDLINKSGQDLKNFVSVYLDFIIDATKYILFGDLSITSIPVYLETALRQLTNIGNSSADAARWFTSMADYLLKLKVEIKNDISYKSTIEAYLMRLCV